MGSFGRCCLGQWVSSLPLDPLETQTNNHVELKRNLTTVVKVKHKVVIFGDSKYAADSVHPSEGLHMLLEWMDAQQQGRSLTLISGMPCYWPWIQHNTSFTGTRHGHHGIPNNDQAYEPAQ